ncbi:MAG TPA: oxidoreductase [Bacteroidales bacterium]|nr:MAG: oxidoreductase [Bacteroidetes bacterium GWE2_42_24]OFY31550.1 MAG: oxidoreductase [Bacteroidetes bacterium GWF2_43_11]HAQ65737.1 oxidoreductase [Bacteroidales bacterium]HBZ67200.1 oxidoreductase [Bacteroidales bacterium]
MKLITPAPWPDYELIDTGDFQKLERFGRYITTRPEPKALWDKALPDAEWQRLSHAVFRKTKDADPGEREERGEWFMKPGMPDQWYVEFKYLDLAIKMRLGLTPFKHTGIFPEQADNWRYIFDTIRQMQHHRPRVLNLFAYTGAASLVARAAGAEVVHVEALKQLIGWSKVNMEASGLTDIRWMPEDALKFVKREIRRGNHYQGIIMDPPAYGRGPNGEKWILEDNIKELFQLTAELIDPEHSFVVINLYSKGTNPLISQNLYEGTFGKRPGLECGELYIADQGGRKMPFGTILRDRWQ